jgi:hypothetical protein
MQCLYLLCYPFMYCAASSYVGVLRYSFTCYAPLQVLCCTCAVPLYFVCCVIPCCAVRLHTFVCCAIPLCAVRLSKCCAVLCLM